VLLVLTERKFRDDSVRNLKEHFVIVFWVVDTDVLNIPRNVCLTSGCFYSNISLFSLPPERRNADLSDILDYQPIHIFA